LLAPFLGPYPMGQYEQAALKAVQLFNAGRAVDPVDAWHQATVSIFGRGTWSQEKSCPRDAFLGLCTDGHVKGVRPGNYTESVANKSYAVAAAQLLKSNPGLTTMGTTGLWKRVLKRLNATTSKAHNGQMNVVLALFRNKLLI